MPVKKYIKKIVYGVYPDAQKINLLAGQWLYDRKIKLARKSIIQRYRGQKNLLINVGCGSQGKDGWINLDYGSYEGVNCNFDCRRKLPFENNSVKAIFTEHFLEHLDYQTEAKEFLSHCYRVLEPGGVIRIIVPDAEKYLFGYCSPGWNVLNSVRPLTPNHEDCHLTYRYNTKMELINVVFRQFGEHKFAYDYETLKYCLEQAGFRDIFKMSFQKSHLQELTIDLEIRKSESLYVEAIK